MGKLTCLDSVSKWVNEQTTQHPEVLFFINKLKGMIESRPENGLDDPILSTKGKTIPCRKQSVSLYLFPHQHAIGYDHITATYIYNKAGVVIIKMDYS